jgi:hypothetical protein
MRLIKKEAGPKPRLINTLSGFSLCHDHGLVFAVFSGRLDRLDLDVRSGGFDLVRFFGSP